MRWLFLLCLALSLPTADGVAGAAQPVRYCDYPVYPPISWSDGHEVRGLAPQTVRSVLGELGYEVKTVVLGNWKRCLLDAAEGRVDVVLAYQTPQRDDGLLFSRVPVLREEVAIFYNRQQAGAFRPVERSGELPWRAALRRELRT